MLSSALVEREMNESVNREELWHLRLCVRHLPPPPKVIAGKRKLYHSGTPPASQHRPGTSRTSMKCRRMGVYCTVTLYTRIYRVKVIQVERRCRP
jgi:hypothetical protein